MGGTRGDGPCVVGCQSASAMTKAIGSDTLRHAIAPIRYNGQFTGVDHAVGTDADLLTRLTP